MSLTVRAAAPASAQPKPQTPKAPKAQKEPGNAEADKVSDAFGLQGFVQDSAKVAQAVTVHAGRANRLASAVSGLADGEDGAVANVVAATTRGAIRAANRMPAGAGQRLLRGVVPVAEGAGKLARGLGRVGPIVSIPFAGYDVYKAVAEPDPAKKDAAWANASLSVGGTALGAFGAMAMATPAGVPMLVASAAVGGFQLLDTYAFGGKCMDWLGAHAWKPVAGAVKKLIGRN